jgi:hypothetical protein
MHAHAWHVLADPATGLWCKRQCPGDGRLVPGHAERCACGKARFVPAPELLDAGFRIVPIDPDPTEEKS